LLASMIVETAVTLISEHFSETSEHFSETVSEHWFRRSLINCW
jgi:hypothetical protein